MEHILAGLNEEQAEAVQAARGPVVILAGAGTGKTTTITRRIAYQVATEAFAANQLLAVTFTVKAAREMGTRLRALGVDGVRANTFHAEALGQFRRFSGDNQPEILGHKGQILHKLAQRLPPPHKFTALRDLATEIEWAKNRRISAKDYPAKIGGHEPPIPVEFMHHIYVEYEKRKRAMGSIDFEDLLERLGTILEETPKAQGLVRGRYAAFTVDEYQDVNLLQQRLLDLWLGSRDELCVVGDDYQSIFGFTGATPKYLLRFADRFERAHVVTLTENHRSTPEILDVANRLVPKLGGSKKRLRATLAPGPSPLLKDFERGEDEVTWIAGECARLHKQGTPYEEMAVLFRLNGRSEDFEEAFARAKIPYQVRDGSFLNRPAARAFIARARAVGADTVASTAVAEIAKTLGHDPAGQYGSGDEATRQADLARLVMLATGFDGDLGAFVGDLRARFAPDDEGRGVHLLTYHRSKGLEFDAVFLPRLEERELPFALSASEEEIAEERRLFYVGITRARKHLAISYARRRDGERRTRPKPSMFLSEIRPRSGSAAATPVVAAAAPRAARAVRPTSPMYEALRAWRAETSAAAGLPAYVVFHDKVLAEICAVKPMSPADLRGISGVGALKMQRYGEAVLKIVGAHATADAASA